MSFDFRSARGEAHVMGAHINGEARCTVKLATGFYENTRKGLPTASGMSLVSSAAALKPAPERPGLFVGAEDLGQKLAASSSQRVWASTLSECCFAWKAVLRREILRTAMSEENVEVVRQMIDRFNRDGFLPEDLFDPDVELFNIRESPLPGPYHGYEGLREWREGVFEVVEEGRFEVDNFQDVEEAELVIYGIRLLGRARHTGLEMDLAWSNVNWFREGRIYRSKSFTNRAEALEAAGLS